MTLPTDVHTPGQTRSVRKGRKEVEEKKGRKKLPVPERGFEPTTLTLEGKAPVPVYTAQRSLVSVAVYKYLEGYILNSIAQYPMHMKERERKCHRAEFEGTENY